MVVCINIYHSQCGAKPMGMGASILVQPFSEINSFEYTGRTPFNDHVSDKFLYETHVMV